MLTNLLMCAALAGEPSFEVKALSSTYLTGEPFTVQVDIQAPAEGAEVKQWMLLPSAFALNDKPLGGRTNETAVPLSANAKLTLVLDLAPQIAESKDWDGTRFKLTYADDKTKEIEVTAIQAAEKGLNFMEMPVEDLSKYRVVMETSRGTLEMEFWPDVAPNHVRNFLDLCYTGFYNGTGFHRVIPDFMIQGGDPTGTGTGSGKRQVKAEFNARKHERGVLSMARSQDPNSASCQFFVMHAAYPSLDGKYTAFGKLTSGLDVVDKIVKTPRGANDKPNEPQKIVKATVIKASAK